MSDAAAFDPVETSPPPGTSLSRPLPGVVLMGVEGEVDTLSAPRFEADLEVATSEAAAEHAAIVVDLTRVTFLASSGLAVLIRGAHRARDRGRRLQVVAATRAVTRPLQVTGADVLFDVHPDVGSALATVAAGVAPPLGE